MTSMSLRLNFEGGVQVDGNITVSWKRPDRLREEGPHQFGLGVVEVLQDNDAYDMIAFSDVGSFLLYL